MAKHNQIKVEDESGEDPTLIKKVDEMMGTEAELHNPAPQPVSEVVPEDNQEEVSDLPPLDIFADTKTAPLLNKSKGPKASKIIVKDETDHSVEETGVAVEAKTDTTEQSSPPAEESTEIAPIVETKERAKKESVVSEADEPSKEDEVVIKDPPTKAEEFDDPTTSKAIEDIVAKESDEVLKAEDSKIATKKAAVKQKESKSSHPLFWSLVVFLCIVAIAMAVFIIDPTVHNPINKLNWSSLKSHL